MITTRPPKQSDAAFIVSSWITSYHKHWPLLPSKVMHTSYRPHVERCLESSSIIVTSLADDPDCIIGYIVYNGDTIHYIYVKYACRRQGVASELISAAEKAGETKLTKVTHLPIWAGKKKDIFFKKYQVDPFSFFRSIK